MPNNPEVRQSIVDTLEADFPTCTLRRTNHEFVEVIASGRDKSGIREVLAHAGIDDYELNTFGDSLNDLPMHAIADHSYSFTNSPPDVKRRRIK